MRKFFLTAFLSASMLTLFAQQDTIFLKKEAKKRIVTDRQPQAFFAELGGPGIAFSANYDRRFKKEIGGLGYRIGLGYSFDNSFKFTTVPIGINYLMGDKVKGRFFEVGLNETIFLPNRNNDYYADIFTIGSVDVPYKTSLITSATLGYRSQPTRGGFNFRGGVLPFMVQGEAGISAYLSFGYNF